MTNNLLITGAGVDRSEGIDFPLASTLLADIARYLEKDGKAVDEALREILPGLRFSFNKMISAAVDKIATRETHEQRAMVERVQKAIKNLPEDQEQEKKLGELIVRLFIKLAVIAENNNLDDETEKLIREVFPKEADELLDSDSILDIHKLSLSDTFKAVLKRTLKMGLGGEYHPIANALGADMLNIETLLVEKFLGFYNEKPADIKNYLYISWVLWAFLVERQKQVLGRCGVGELPFYGKLPDNIRAITLNYTSFLKERLGDERALYFHGGLAEYVRMDTRDLLKIENILDCNPQQFIRKIISPNVDVKSDDVRQHRHVIPALVPPLRLKPILSHKYIELWGKAAKWVEEASHIVVVGYSFNSADEHFNDILRNHSEKKIDVVVLEADDKNFKARMEKVFNVPASQFCTITVQNVYALQCRKLRLIPAKASDIDIASLFRDK